MLGAKSVSWINQLCTPTGPDPLRVVRHERPAHRAPRTSTTCPGSRARRERDPDRRGPPVQTAIAEVSHSIAARRRPVLDSICHERRAHATAGPSASPCASGCGESHAGHRLLEREYDHVLLGSSTAVPTLNPAEVEDSRWVGRDELDEAMRANPTAFIPWLTSAREIVRDRIPPLCRRCPPPGQGATSCRNGRLGRPHRAPHSRVGEDSRTRLARGAGHGTRCG